MSGKDSEPKTGIVNSEEEKQEYLKSLEDLSRHNTAINVNIGIKHAFIPFVSHVMDIESNDEQMKEGNGLVSEYLVLYNKIKVFMTKTNIKS